MIRPSLGLVLGCALLSGCATQTLTPEQPVAAAGIPRFSIASPDEPLPRGWRPLRFSRFKNNTDYRLVKDAGRVVVRAHADASASALVHETRIDPHAFPVLRWRWKVNRLIEGADNTRRDREDSPVRLILTFSGDKARWDFSDRLFAAQLKMLSGHELPYATLIYIWENRAASGTVIPSTHTARVKMVVARSGRDRLGQWSDESRDVVEDFRRAFGEIPGQITSLAVMTDSDNTGTVASGYYGDIELERPRPAVASWR